MEKGMVSAILPGMMVPGMMVLKFIWITAQIGEPLPGVTILNDGSRFEGLRDNRLNGLGVMWTSEGKVMTIGEWADGKVIVDRNHELYIKSRWFYG